MDKIKTEAATSGAIWKKVFLEIWQNSPENRPKACNFIRKETVARVFSCEFCEMSKSNFITEHLWTNASN